VYWAVIEDQQRISHTPTMKPFESFVSNITSLYFLRLTSNDDVSVCE